MSLSNEAKLHCCLQDSRPQPPTTVVSRPRGGAVSHINTTKTKISHKVEVLSSTFSNLTLWPTPLKKIPKQDDGLVRTRVVSVVVPSADEKNRAEAEKRRERKQLVAAKRGGGNPAWRFIKRCPSVAQMIPEQREEVLLSASGWVTTASSAGAL